MSGGMVIKRFSIGFMVGLLFGLILATTTFSFAANQIKLIIDGEEVQSDVPPMMVNGRIMIPIRIIAECVS